MPKPRHTALAKVSPPRVAEVVQRERLFAAIDAVRGHGALWIAASPGSGKTTLLASYVESRGPTALWYRVDADDSDPATFFHYMNVAAEAGGRMRRGRLPRVPTDAGMDVATFARRYFRALFTLLRGDSVVVLDNYQEATGSTLDTILRHAVEEAPAHVLIVVLSLTPPPSTVARLVATQAISRFDPERMRFTLDEAREVARCFGTADTDIEALHEQSGGWAAGLILMLEHARYAGGSVLTPAPDMESAVFDYFAGEIFARAGSAQQRVLMTAAFLPTITAATAIALTGEHNAGDLLDELAVRHLFTTRTSDAEATYHFHGLFRAFLLARARERFTAIERDALTLRATELLAAHGRLEEAVAAALAWSQHDAAASLILRNAPMLFEQGRRRLLTDWITALPREHREREPWLLYWAGASQVFFDAHEGRSLLERSYDRFVARGDVAGQIMSAGAITRAFMHEISWAGVDRWLEVLDRLLAGPLDDVAPRVVLLGLSRALYVTVTRQPAHPRAREWADRALAMLGADIDANDLAMAGFSLMMHHNWYGGVVAQERIIGWVQPLATEGKLDAVSTTYWNWVFALYLLNVRASEDALRAMDRAIETAASHGLLIAAVLRQFRVGICLSLGHVDEAAASLAEMDDVTRTLPRVEPYNEMKSWLALIQGDLMSAESTARAALEIATDRGRTLYQIIDLAVLAQAQIECGACATAAATIADLRRRAAGVPGYLLEYQAILLDAYLSLQEGRARDCEAALRVALATGSREKIVNHWTWYPRMMARLYAAALDAGIEVDYVRDVIARRRLEPEAPYAANWPWPLRVRTLGSFEVLRHGVPLVWEGKAQRKPLQLLKALIGLRGRDVSIDTLVGLLWPSDAQHDGQKAFEITVHRLRKLLDAPDAIKITDRRVTLNPRRVFVDVLALDEALAAVVASANAPEPNIGRLEQAAPSILELFRGPFLPGDAEEPWVIALRNRLAGRFERFVHRLGDYWERQQRWECASSLYVRAIELDPLGELYYRRHMVCLHAQGRRAEAIEVFRRCRHMLSVVLSIKPSVETQAVYEKIIGDETQAIPRALSSRTTV